MEENSHKHRPWELITAALQGELEPEEKFRLQSWLEESPANQEEFERLQRLWNDEIADYPRYLEADESQGWSHLERRLAPSPAPRIGWRRWAVAVGAALIITTGLAVLWYYERAEQPREYVSIANQQRKLTLPDGTSMTLGPSSRVRIEAGYNRSTRSVTLIKGQARFDVVHETSRPFIVNAGPTTIRDIGTSFTVSLSDDSVGVIVTTGKVSVEDSVTHQTLALAAGEKTSIATVIGTSTAALDLKFDKTPLSAVLQSLQKHYGKTILLKASNIATKRLTANLQGESLEEAIKVICASFNLDSRADSNGYVLSMATR